MENEMRTVDFLVCILYRIDKVIKDNFQYYVNDRSLDGALQKMRENNELPEWFSKVFTYDPLYGQLWPLRQLLSTAFFTGLIRMDGTRFDYHLDQISPRTLQSILKETKFEPANIEKFAKRLSEIILNPTK